MSESRQRPPDQSRGRCQLLEGHREYGLTRWAVSRGTRTGFERNLLRRTVKEDGSITFRDVTEEGWEDDPAYERHGIHCYHGTPITVDGSLYGTVCFVSEEPRDDQFTSDETLFAELIARMLEHELEQRRSQAKIDRLDQFASVVSHDLRNPLNVAQLRVEQERATDDSSALAAADRALERMETIITDVLHIARQAEAVEDTEVVSLESLCEDCWENVHTAEATLTVDSDLEFRAARDRLKHLFENLFRNAVEHAGEDVSVRVGRLTNGRGFYVEDDGPGIPEEQRDTIFESGHTTSTDGLGIGLTLVDSIVTAHEWRIETTESTDGGARFEVSDVVVQSPAE